MASKAMGFARDSKERVGSVLGEIASTRSVVTDLLDRIGNISQDISRDAGKGVTGQQFEDIVRQLLEEVDERIAELRELISSLSGGLECEGSEVGEILEGLGEQLEALETRAGADALPPLDSSYNHCPPAGATVS